MAYADANLTLAGGIGYAGGQQTIGGQSLVGSGGITSTGVIDLSSGGIGGGLRDVGSGDDYDYLRVFVLVGIVGATSVEFQAIQHDDTAQSTNVTVVGSSGPIPVASLTAGARLAIQINPRVGSKGQRYMSGRWVITGTCTAGSIFADIGAEIQDGQKFINANSQVL